MIEPERHEMDATLRIRQYRVAGGGGQLVVWTAQMVMMVAVLVVGGCDGTQRVEWPWQGEESFPVEDIQLHRSFTRVVPGQGEQPEQIEAYVQLRDQYGDPTKATGQLRFEVFRFRSGFADPQGSRFEQGGLVVVDLQDAATSQKHWDPITRGYKAVLALPDQAESLRRLVLQATYVSDAGYRIEDEMVLDRRVEP